MSFDFTGTAQCSLCGAFLSDSTEECDDHDGVVAYRFFREMGTGTLRIVVATFDHKWQKLYNQLGEEWLGWVYVGTRVEVDQRLGNSHESVEDLPIIAGPWHADDPREE